jgi:hypothetical protein
MHAPQSSGQLVHVSPEPGSHVALPQVTHAPQSPGQVMQVSPSEASHIVSPQTWHMPQSMPQVVQLSVPLHTWSPQIGAGAS